MVVAADVATPTPAPGNWDSISSTPRNSCSHFTKSRPSGVKLQQLYKNHFLFFKHSQKEIASCEHHPFYSQHGAQVASFRAPNTSLCSTFLVHISMACAAIVFHYFFEDRDCFRCPLKSKSLRKPNYLYGEKNCKTKNALCNCLTGFGAVTRTGFCSIPKCSSRPATRCDSSPTCTHQRKNFHATYGTSVILNWTTLTML